MKPQLHEIDVDQTLATTASLLAGQSIPDSVTPDDRIYQLIKDARKLYSDLAEPKSLTIEIERDQFAELFIGERNNHPDALLTELIPLADSFTLFASTAGQKVCTEIERLFASNEFPLASMLDATASEGADLVAEITQEMIRKQLKNNDQLDAGQELLRFSPGYCGWHISGQHKLFDTLQPSLIGIELSESYLMSPLKSVSGVILKAPIEAFDIYDNFPYCADCRNRSCRDRYHTLVAKMENNK